MPPASHPDTSVRTPGQPIVVQDAARDAWMLIKDTTHVNVFEEFIRRYRDSFCASLAQARLNDLRETTQLAAAMPPVGPTVTPSMPDARTARTRRTLREWCDNHIVFRACTVSVVGGGGTRAQEPKDVFRERDKGCPDMVEVPAGASTMGSPESEEGRDFIEGPQHRVTIPEPFAVGRFPVTVDQFAGFVAATGHDAGSVCSMQDGGEWIAQKGLSWKNPGFAQDGRHPAVCLNWKDAKAYAAWLSRETGRNYRLLSESEYEYAARAGSSGQIFFGDEKAEICRYGNGLDRTAQQQIPGLSGRAGIACSDGYAYTAPPGSFATNGFGLCDMLGNAWSWVEDCYHRNYNRASADGSAWMSAACETRALRGGSWANSTFLRAARRGMLAAGTREATVGFRVARTLHPK